MRRRGFWILGAGLLAIVAGCSSPSPRFIGLTPTRADIDGFTFDVYHRGAEAQAIRLNRVAGPPNTAAVVAAGARAAGVVTGCEVLTGKVEGNSIVVTVPLACP